jgi:hypothetical protein
MRGTLVLFIASTFAFAMQPAVVSAAPDNFFLAPAPRMDPNLPPIIRAQAAQPKAVVSTPAINTGSRAAVKAAYNTYYNLPMPAMSWTGSIAGCVPGTISSAFQEWTISRMNFLRAMAGASGNTTLDTSLNAQQQATALIMAANNTITHSPTPVMTCYSASGAAGANSSNLEYGVDDSLQIYMSDPGTNFVGHRRWILYSAKGISGLGQATGPSGSYSALSVFDGSGSSPLAGNGIPWPPRGYVPLDLFPSLFTGGAGQLWSFGLPGADFSAANVSMTLDGSPVAVTVVSRTDFGYGDNTLVWQLPVGHTVTKGTVYDVTITGVASAGSTTYNYQIRPFDPADPLPTMGDLDASGTGDLLWRNSADGSVQGWLMSGLNATQVAGMLPAGSYAVTHEADLNGDGTADLLIRNADGSVIGWLMNGLSVIGTTTFVGPGSAWSIVKTADLDGDGKADLIWQNTDGTVQAWLMDGLTATSTATLIGPGTGWSLSQVADLDGDGKSDLIWQNADGTVQAWLMNGLAATSIASYAPAGSGWSVVLVGDFDGDGKSDLFWQHTNGASQAWLMNGLAVSQIASFTPAGTGWTPVLAGDLDGNGTADIFWQHTSGASQTWLMNGLTVSGLASFVPAGTGWSASLVRDLDGDGKQDVLWTHTSGAVQAWLMNGLTITQIGSFAGAGTYEVVPFGTKQGAIASAYASAFATGDYPVPADCGASTPVNCPGGIPTPTSMHLDRSAMSIVATGSDAYTLTVPVALSSLTDIVVQLPVIGSCNLRVATAAGSSPTVNLVFDAAYQSDVAGGSLRRLHAQSFSLTSAEQSDFTLTGGFGCSTANPGIGAYLSILQNALAPLLPADACGLPGQPLLPCS